MTNDNHVELPDDLKELAAVYRQQKTPAYFTERVMANVRTIGRRKLSRRLAWAGAVVTLVLVTVVTVPMLQRAGPDLQLAQTGNEVQVSTPGTAAMEPLALDLPESTEPLDQTPVMVLAESWLDSGSVQELPSLADLDEAISLSDIPDPLG